jgi:hypothetical protein
MVKNQLQGMIDPAFTLESQATAWFDGKYFAQCPNVAKLLGCTPDYNAWTGEQNPMPRTDEPYRTGGGHIHSGWTKDQDPDDDAFRQEGFMVIKQLDVMVGQYSPLWDGDLQRRILYGAAGACRIKPYGAEYRSLSNAWLQDPAIISWVYRQVYTGIELLSKGKNFVPAYGKKARQIINSNKPIPLGKLVEYLQGLPFTKYNGLPPILAKAA